MTTTLESPATGTVLDLHGARVHAYPHGDDLAGAVAELRTDLAGHPADWLAFDIETNALDLEDPRHEVRSVQIGTSRVVLVLDTERESLAAAWDLLNDPAHRLTAHNAAFDTTRLHRIGIIADLAEVWSRLSDTFILASLIEPPGGSPISYRTLKAQTRTWCGPDAVSADAKADLKAAYKAGGWKGLAIGWDPYKEAAKSGASGDPRDGNGWAQIPLDDLAFIAYAAADIVDSAQLVRVLAPIASAVFPEIVQVEHRMARIATEMESRGVRLDTDYTLARQADSRAAMDEAEATMRAAGFTGRPSNAGDAIAFFDAEGMPPRRTAKGGRSTEAATLREYAQLGSSLAEPLLRWRTHQKLDTTYYSRYLRAGADRIHPTVTTLQASTGRMSSSSPNFQNLPARDAKVHVRECFVADPGMTFISADFSSIEMRVSAAVTGDPKLRAMYVDPLTPGEDPRARDPYWLMAWELHGPWATKAQRGAVKAVVLGRMYGGSVGTLADQAGITLDAAQAALDAYGAMYPGLATWAGESLIPGTVGVGRPLWTLPGGRVQVIDPTDHWKALNTFCQGLARDVLVRAILACEDAGLAQYLVMPIHDELLLQVPEDRAEGLLALLVETMRSEVLGVPIPAEGALLGPRWTAKD